MGIFKKFDQLKKESQDKSETIRVLKLWLEKMTDNSKFIEEYLKQKDIHTVAVYGINTYSDLLVRNLLQLDITIKCFIAGDWSVNTYGINIKGHDEIDSISREVDCIINVTSEKIDDKYRVISFFDILFDR